MLSISVWLIGQFVLLARRLVFRMILLIGKFGWSVWLIGPLMDWFGR